MILENEKLDKLIDKFTRQAERQFQNYQETGLRRYEKAYEDATDMADSLQMARDAADDHTKMLNYRFYIYSWAIEAQRVTDQAGAEKLLKGIVSAARMHGLIRDDSLPKEE